MTIMMVYILPIYNSYNDWSQVIIYSSLGFTKADGSLLGFFSWTNQLSHEKIPVNVWCGLIKNLLILLQIFAGSLNGEVYLILKKYIGTYPKCQCVSGFEPANCYLLIHLISNLYEEEINNRGHLIKCIHFCNEIERNTKLIC